MAASAIAIAEVSDVPADVEAWTAYVERHAGATVYHRLAWRRIFGEAFGYRSWMLLARAPAGTVGALPLFLVRAPWGSRLVAVPFRDRGGPLWDTPDAFHALVEDARRIARVHRAASLELKTTTAYPDELVRQQTLRERRYWINSVVDLQTLHADTLMAALGQKVRNMVRQAEKEGLRADLVVPDAAVARAWYEVYLRTQRKLGLPPFPRRFFELMFDELGRVGALRVCLVRAGGATVAACVILLNRREAIYGYSASDPQAASMRPADFMLFHALQWLLRNGYTRFDLGSDAPSQESLLFFKRKWLATQTPIPVYSRGAAAHSDSSALRYRLLRAVVRKLPLAVVGSLGPRVVRYFG